MSVPLLDRIKSRIHRNMERERNIEKYVDALSHKLWPYSELKLILYASLLPVLDWLSTFNAIVLSGKNIHEVGLIGRWALQTGGFARLFLMEFTAMTALICLAIGFKIGYAKLGFGGFGRAAFVILLVPSLATVTIAIYNNILLALF